MNAVGNSGIFPVQTLQQSEAGLIDEAMLMEKTDDPLENNKKKLLCKSCLHPITSEAYSIVVNGAHSHTFMNPHGIVFNIACFARAGGCFYSGNPTAAFTWFSGYYWRHAMCANCLDHLGWHYQSGGSGFYGLILDRLTKE